MKSVNYNYYFIFLQEIQIKQYRKNMKVVSQRTSPHCSVMQGGFLTPKTFKEPLRIRKAQIKCSSQPSMKIQKQLKAQSKVDCWSKINLASKAKIDWILKNALEGIYSNFIRLEPLIEYKIKKIKQLKIKNLEQLIKEVAKRKQQTNSNPKSKQKRNNKKIIIFSNQTKQSKRQSSLVPFCEKDRCLLDKIQIEIKNFQNDWLFFKKNNTIVKQNQFTKQLAQKYSKYSRQINKSILIDNFQQISKLAEIIYQRMSNIKKITRIVSSYQQNYLKLIKEPLKNFKINIKDVDNMNVQQIIQILSKKLKIILRNKPQQQKQQEPNVIDQNSTRKIYFKSLPIKSARQTTKHKNTNTPDNLLNLQALKIKNKILFEVQQSNIQKQLFSANSPNHFNSSSDDKDNEKYYLKQSNKNKVRNNIKLKSLKVIRDQNNFVRKDFQRRSQAAALDYADRQPIKRKIPQRELLNFKRIKRQERTKVNDKYLRSRFRRQRKQKQSQISQEQIQGKFIIQQEMQKCQKQISRKRFGSKFLRKKRSDKISDTSLEQSITQLKDQQQSKSKNSKKNIRQELRNRHLKRIYYNEEQEKNKQLDIYTIIEIQNQQNIGKKKQLIINALKKLKEVGYFEGKNLKKYKNKLNKLFEIKQKKRKRTEKVIKRHSMSNFTLTQNGFAKLNMLSIEDKNENIYKYLQQIQQQVTRLNIPRQNIEPPQLKMKRYKMNSKQQQQQVAIGIKNYKKDFQTKVEAKNAFKVQTQLIKLTLHFIKQIDHLTICQQEIN